MSERFAAIAGKAAALAGSYVTFIVALALVVVWGISGPFFAFSETWQLVINTSTTIVTFLMVFLIQNSQNRDSIALHLKLDELLRAIEQADDKLIEAEYDSERELQQLKAEYHRVAEMQSTEDAPATSHSRKSRQGE